MTDFVGCGYKQSGGKDQSMTLCLIFLARCRNQPSRPRAEANSQTAAGMGTTCVNVCVKKPWPSSAATVIGEPEAAETKVTFNGINVS